jgi:hypothetical protein
VNATKLPDTICARRNTRFTRLGDRFRITHTIRSISVNAMRKPTVGDSSPGLTTLSHTPCHSMTSQPAAAIAAPAIPPMSAWLELDGKPRNHVTRFQVIAPTRPARTTLNVTASGFTIPVATVAATLSETNAPAKLRMAASRTAVRGVRARVETLVAIALAVSWKPFLKSKKRATITTATSVRSSIAAFGSGVLHDDVGDHVRRRFTGVERALQRLRARSRRPCRRA